MLPLLKLVISNLCALPILLFLCGFALSCTKLTKLLRACEQNILIYFLLFSIGLKGGISFQGSIGVQFFYLLGLLIAWGLLQPFLSFWILRKFTNTDTSTAAVIASCFGSVSLVTFAAATAFLEKLNISYESLVISLLAIMEIPAIFSGLFISKWQNLSQIHKTKGLLKHTFFNKTIGLIILGLLSGIVCNYLEFQVVTTNIKKLFNPSLYIFLLNMGFLIGRQRKDLHHFSFSLCLFGCYMPLLGGAFGLLLSCLCHLNVGSATLVAVLTASASYIAVPAAMKVAIPQAKESIYLPLALMIAFPFNILLGIPTYFLLASKLLS
jgi:hypothetical protein